MPGKRLLSAPLIACPSYPNSISWSEENLLAIASGHLISILNPATPTGPRGVITLPPHKPFHVGTVKKEDLLTSCLFPICLSRQTIPCARSISWSPLGFAPNSGCLLAVCTNQGRVKVYCLPFSELRTEWAEVIDISDLLFDYFAITNYRIPGTSNQDIEVEISTVDATHQISEDVMSKGSRKEIKSLQCAFSSSKSETIPSITSREYTFRSSLLSSLVVAWSPILHSSPRDYAILAVGGKAGLISFWRIHTVKSYVCEHVEHHEKAVLVGLLNAHNSWVTAISWGTCWQDASVPRLVLVTGSSDGSLKIWLGNADRLNKSTVIVNSCFCLVKELTPITHAPITSISIAATRRFVDRLLLAIGKGSGSLEAWICDISMEKFVSTNIYDAHGQVITGLAWAYDGRFLYSCSQDTFLRRWILSENALHESSCFPDTLKFQNSCTTTRLSDPCYGLALSSGSLMLSVVRSLDSKFLNPMYQAKTQKAAVECYWTTGQSLELMSENDAAYSAKDILGLSQNELECLELDLLWSLKQYENVNTQLYLWDVLVVLQSISKSSFDFINCILGKWFSSWFSDSTHCGSSLEGILFHIKCSLSKISVRRLHLLNIICRRLIVVDIQEHAPLQHDCRIDGEESEQLSFWKELLLASERELQERLVAFTFKALVTFSHSAGLRSSSLHWVPSGVPQMEQWVAKSTDLVSEELKHLASKFGSQQKRYYSVSDCDMEYCHFCSAPVAFESPDFALCSKKHKLMRCSTSMQLSGISSCQWFCACCHRSTSKLIPETFFTVSQSPLDDSFEMPSCLVKYIKPLCPFCGIVLQKAQPDFYLSTCPL